MSSIFVNNLDGSIIGLFLEESEFKLGSRFYLRADDKHQLYTVVDSIPVFQLQGDITVELAETGQETGSRLKQERSIIYVEPIKTQVDLKNAKLGHGGEMNKYLIVKQDGQPVKEDSEYAVFNIRHDPHTHNAVKVYHDSAINDPSHAAFAEELLLRVQQIRKEG